MTGFKEQIVAGTEFGLAARFLTCLEILSPLSAPVDRKSGEGFPAFNCPVANPDLR